jgi:uncharacterized protein YigA (DUF484 family)
MEQSIDPALLADYLSKHPDFFNQFPDLLTTLSITHPHGTHAISITERQVLSMRDKVQLLEGKLAELIRFGEENDSISEKNASACPGHRFRARHDCLVRRVGATSQGWLRRSASRYPHMEYARAVR